MNFLAYLHSIWFTHKQLKFIFSDNNEYEYFFNNLSYEILKKYISNEEQIKNILDNKKRLNIKNIDKKINDLKIKLITIWSKNYPELLKNISNPPYFLYVRWNLIWNDNFFSIVWSRKITQYTKKVWEKIIPDLSKYFTIVSWWAGGADTLAHKITLDNEWKTIVVFGTWIDITYPSSNFNLFEKIIDSWWALVSIFPIWTPWGFYTFPVRNEIVAGISRWILVLEAWEKSWTLITVNMWLEQGKDIFAIPGDIFVQNQIWTNNLIKNSQAKLVTESYDILSEYNYQKILLNKEIKFENDIEQNIFNILKINIPLSIDELIEKTQYDYVTLSLNITLMELKWLVKKNMLWKYWV